MRAGRGPGFLRCEPGMPAKVPAAGHRKEKEKWPIWRPVPELPLGDGEVTFLGAIATGSMGRDSRPAAGLHTKERSDFGHTSSTISAHRPLGLQQRGCH